MSHRLVIFTGKGGVGKTTAAMAYTKKLQNSGKKVLYNSFNHPIDLEVANQLNLPIFNTSIIESAEIYIANKLGSKTIASWVMGTHFFKSLFQMVPGFGHMILMGHILKELENNSDLTIVLDSPASGHALTMFEASSNFKKIFRTGLIVKDIEKMRSMLEDKNFLTTYILALPTELAIQEAKELKNELEAIYNGVTIIINNSLLKYCELENIQESELPNFLKEKFAHELNFKNTYKLLPHIPEINFATTVLKILPNIGELE